MYSIDNSTARKRDRERGSRCDSFGARPWVISASIAKRLLWPAGHLRDRSAAVRPCSRESTHNRKGERRTWNQNLILKFRHSLAFTFPLPNRDRFGMPIPSKAQAMYDTHTRYYTSRKQANPPRKTQALRAPTNQDTRTLRQQPPRTDGKPKTLLLLLLKHRPNSPSWLRGVPDVHRSS